MRSKCNKGCGRRLGRQYYRAAIPLLREKQKANETVLYNSPLDLEFSRCTCKLTGNLNRGVKKLHLKNIPYNIICGS